MTSFGIICEFNPLHNGHKRLIEAAKENGADCVVCVMSGNAVQRGELAAVDKYDRAKAAILCGADLVVELPYPWCAASAEFFAQAGVEILSHFCRNIIFGSESGDVALLQSAARTAGSDMFKEEYKRRIDSGEGAAAAYFSMLNQVGNSQLSSNDLLGIEYIRAAMEKELPVEFYTIKREGAAYNQDVLDEEICPSATAIRNAWREGKDASPYMPQEVVEIFENADITDISRISNALLMYFRLAEEKDFSNIAETDGGIVNRIIQAAKEAVDEKDFFDKIRTKRYTDAKLRRAILFCLTGVTKGLLKASPAYITMLGASQTGRELLSSVRKNEGINIVTKSADSPRDSEQFAVGEKLEAIFTLAGAKVRDVGDSYRKKPFIK